MEIRRSKTEDIPGIMEIYARARKFMTEHGNPRQWSLNGWPPQSLIEQDIQAGNSYVCLENERIVGTFYYIAGTHIEPTYEVIENGRWIGDETYGVVHRIAVDGTVKGTGSFCIDWAFAQCGHVRIDTHPDNKVMQNLLAKLGFQYCGIIYVEEDDDPRYAYEKL